MTLGTRSARGWAQLGLQAGLFATALVLFQVVAERTNRRIDLTPTRSLSLSPVTQKIVKEVAEPLTATVFFRRGQRGAYSAFLQRLQVANPHVHYDLFDLDRYPDRARSVGVTQYGQAALEYRGRRTVVAALPEEEFAGGVLRLLRGRGRTLLFTSGHGERTPGGGQEGYGRLVAELQAESFEPDGISLLDGPVPPDTDLVLVAGPKHDFLDSELDALADYVRQGGGVLLLLEPGPLPNLSRFLASMGIRLGDDFIVDKERKLVGTDGLAAVVELFKRGNPISDPAANQIESGVVLPSARTVDVEKEMPGVDAESIARTADTAWAMSDPARARRGEEPTAAAHDVAGSASVMVMAEVGHAHEGRGRGRVVVVGDADFTSDAYLDLLGNRDLAMNAIAWVAREDALSGLRPKKIPEVLRPLSPLVLTQPQSRGLLIGVTVIEPALVLATGLVVVGLRRRRG